MSTQGDFDLFATAFPRGRVPDIIRIMFSEWPNVSRPVREPLENRLTNRFAGHLQQVMRTSEEPMFRFTCRPKLPTPEADSETGELDIEVTTFSNHPDAFLVVECKRLNVQNESGFASLAGEYVGKDGMGCFITDQYASGGGEGIMLGYVMSRTVADAINSINGQLANRYEGLRLVPPNVLLDSTIVLDHPNVRETNHKMGGQRNLLLAHLFVEFSALKRG